MLKFLFLYLNGIYPPFERVTAQLTLNRKSYQLSKPEIEFHMMEEMYAALCMCTCAEKTTVFGKDDLTIVEWGEELHL